MVNCDLPRYSKININFELLKVSKITSLKIYISSVTEKLETSNLDSIIERVPLGTPPEAVVMTLEGLLSLNLGSKSNSVIEVDRGLLYWG